ncbi:MAG: hypothetical protein AAFO02_17120, partial [Bacteroidota bacterium]
MKRTTNQFASYLSVVAVYLLLLTACAGPEAPSDQSPTLKPDDTRLILEYGPDLPITQAIFFG